MNKNFVGKNICPYCLHKADSAVNENDETMKPGPGDIVLCIRCGEVSEFDKKMKMMKFNVSRLPLEDLKDIRHKQYTIAMIHWKEAQLQ